MPLVNVISEASCYKRFVVQCVAVIYCWPTFLTTALGLYRAMLLNVSD